METITNKMAVRNDYFSKGCRLKAVKSEQTTYVRIPYHVTYQGLPGYKTVVWSDSCQKLDKQRTQYA